MELNPYKWYVNSIYRRIKDKPQDELVDRLFELGNVDLEEGLWLAINPRKRAYLAALDRAVSEKIPSEISEQSEKMREGIQQVLQMTIDMTMDIIENPLRGIECKPSGYKTGGK